jgi:hypothetical protein
MEQKAVDRIFYALRMSGKSQSNLADELQIARSSVSTMLKKEGDLPMKYLEATAKITGFSFDWIRTGVGSEKQAAVKESDQHSSSQKTIEKLEQLVASQQLNIQLLEKEVARLEDELKKKERAK